MLAYSQTLQDINGNNIAPRTTADNVSMADGRTVEIAINDKEGKQWMPNNWKTVADLPISYPKGNTAFFSDSVDWNTIGDGFNCMINTLSYGDGYFAVQHVYNYSTNKAIKYRVVNSPNVWGEWQTVATSADLEQKTDKNTIKGEYIGLNKATYTALPLNADLNTYTVPKTYAWESNAIPPTLINVPTELVNSGAYGKLIVEHLRNNNDMVVQTLIFLKGITLFEFKRCFTTSSWTKWQEIATTEKIDIILLNGWVKDTWGETPKIIKNGKLCTLMGGIRSGTVTVGTTIGSITDANFRPKETYVLGHVDCINTTTGTVTPRDIVIVNNGDIKIDGAIAFPTSTSYALYANWECN